MPCGGVYPIAQHFSRKYLDTANPEHACRQCDGIVDAALDLAVEEWDCYLHRCCLGAFLCGAEGRQVLDHGHVIMVPAVVRPQPCPDRWAASDMRGGQDGRDG